MVIWISILIILTINVLIVFYSSRDLMDKAYSKGFSDGVHCVIEKEYVRLDSIIKND